MSASGIVCVDCGTELQVGDVYAYRATADEDVSEVVCVVCRADDGENPAYGPGNPDWEHDREREDRRGGRHERPR